MYGPFVLFLSVIMLYVLLRITDSDYAFGILVEKTGVTGESH